MMQDVGCLSAASSELYGKRNCASNGLSESFNPSIRSRSNRICFSLTFSHLDAKHAPVVTVLVVPEAVYIYRRGNDGLRSDRPRRL